MKPKFHPFRQSAILTAISLTLATYVQADIFDTNSTASGFGVTDGATYDWWTANTWSSPANDAGTASTVTWINGSRGAFFVGAGTGTNYIVRLGSDGSTATTLQNLALNLNAAANGQLTGAAGNVTIGNIGDTGILTLNASNSVGAYGGTLTVNNGINLNGATMNYRGGNVVINGSVSGTGSSNVSFGGAALGFTNGSGTLTLAGNNSFAGNTAVTSGFTLSLQHTNALGATGGTNTVSSGGTLEVAGGVTISSGESVTIIGAGISTTSIGALRAGTGGGTWAGQITIGDSSARVGATAGNTLTVTGTIVNGSGSALTISGQSGTGVVLLNPSTTNTYSGNTNIVRGILRIGKDNALPTGTTLDVDSANSVTDAATFDLASFSQTVAVLQDTATNSINGKITNSIASSTSTLTVNQSSNSVYDGIIENGSGLVGLTKGGSGNLTLNGVNTHTGGTNIKNGSITISGGNDRLAIASAVVLGDVSTSGKLILGDATTARNQTLAGLTATGTGGNVVGAHATNNSVLTLAIASGTNTINGVLGGAGSNENNLSLTKTGAGTLKLSGANTYGGPTVLTQGILQLGVDPVGTITSSAIGTGTLTFNGGTLSSDGATARSIGNAVTFTGNAGLGDTTNDGKLTFTNNMDLGATARTITVNSAVQLNGSFTNSAAASGLIKAGVGTLIINAANTSFGNTNGFAINGGTVVAAHTAAMGNAGQIVTLSSGSSFGSLDLATDTSANAYVLNFGSVAGAGANVIVNRATSGAAMTHTMGIATMGNTKMNVLAGGNVNSGTPTLEFEGLTLSAGVGGDGAMTLNPTTANILISGAITRTGGSANSLVLDGTSTGNLISGSISGPQTITKSNTSTWELSNANTFTGNTKVTGGTLKLTHNLAMQNSAFDTAGIGTLDLASINTPTFGGLIGDAVTGQDLVLHAGVSSLTLNVGDGVTRTYVKNISGGTTGLTLIKSGASTQILGGINSYAGLTTVSGGELQIVSATAIGGSEVTVNSGAQLALNGGITVSGKTITTSGGGRASGTGAFLGGLQSVSGTNEWAGNVILGADLSRMGARKNATLVISGAIDDGSNTFTAVIRNENQNNTSGAGNATTITELSGVSTYGGNTQLIAGVTRLAGGDNRLPTGTVLQFGGSGANAKFDMNGQSQEVAGLAVMNTNTDTQRDWNANELTNSSGSLSTLTVNTTTDQTFGLTASAFGGRENYTGIITGKIELEKSGTAKLTLSGANTYTGNTTISGGTLALTGSGSIAESAIINVHSGSKFNVTGVTSSATVGASTAQTLKGLGTVEIGSKILNIGANGTLAPGASLGTLTFDVATGGALNFASGSDIAFELGTTGSGNSDIISFSSAGDWLQGTANATLALTLLSGFDYSNTYTIFENVTTTGFTLAGVTGYDKVGYTHTFAQSGNNYQLSFAPVPETSTTLLSLLGSLALLRRRRRN
jgi:autotransporter-associated beta strand protein